MAKNNSNNGLNLTTVLLIVFLILKLTGNIDWSWVWVTSPLWIPIAIVSGLFFIVLIGILIALTLGASLSDIKEKINYYKTKPYLSVKERIKEKIKLWRSK
jgi:hypothetical protein